MAIPRAGEHGQLLNCAGRWLGNLKVPANVLDELARYNAIYCFSLNRNRGVVLAGEKSYFFRLMATETIVVAFPSTQTHRNRSLWSIKAVVIPRRVFS